MLDRSHNTLHIVRSIIEEMPESIRAGQMAQCDRFAYEADLVRSRVPAGSTVCDIGGGWGVFSLAMAACGMKSILLDDFGDFGAEKHPATAPMREIWRRFGVNVIIRDVAEAGLGCDAASLDAVTTFDCLEHWHRSPKRMLHDAAHALRPGGWFVIGTPNSSNVRKRVSAVLGKTAWSAMADWYEQEVFRGHVREPNVDDLRYIARDLGLRDVTTTGRNFAGMHPSRPRWTRIVTPWVDHALRLRPNLCSNIYMIGRKP